MLDEPLAGGHMSRVVRAGDTVRRTAGPWTATTQRLLAHVRARGVTWVPEPPAYSRDVLVRASADRLRVIAAWTDAFAQKTGETALAANGAMYRNHAGWLLRNVG